VTDIAVLLEYYHADASTLGASGKPQLVLCTQCFQTFHKVIDATMC